MSLANLRTHKQTISRIKKSLHQLTTSIRGLEGDKVYIGDGYYLMALIKDYLFLISMTCLFFYRDLKTFGAEATMMLLLLDWF